MTIRCLLQIALMLAAVAVQGGPVSVTRSVANDIPSQPLVRVSIVTASNTLCHAYEEFLPPNLAATNITSGGVWLSDVRAIHWGPFTNIVSVELTYRMAGQQGTYFPSGRLSSDGALAAAPSEIPVPVAAESGIDVPARPSTIAKPVITPSGSTSLPVSATISCTTTGAVICYTLDGTVPGTNSTLYSGSFTVTNASWLRARAFASNAFPSAVASAYFSQRQVTSFPDLSFNVLTNFALQSRIQVGVTQAVPGLCWAYELWLPAGVMASNLTENGVFDPTNGVIRWGPMTQRTNAQLACTVAGRAGNYFVRGRFSVDGQGIEPGLLPVLIRDGTNYASVSQPPSYVGRPVLSPNGSGQLPVTVSVSSATSGAELHYTVDGSPPTAQSALYTNALNFTSNTLLRVRGFKAGMEPSAFVAGTYAGLSSNSLQVIRSISANGTTYPTVELLVIPSAGVQSFAVTETLPGRLTPYGFNYDGTWDNTNGVIKWGPFFGTNSIRLSFLISGLPGTYILTGAGSADGRSSVTTGPDTIQLADEAIAPDLMVTSLKASLEVALESAQPVSWMVINRGTRPVTNNWVDRLYLSTNATLASSRLLAEFTNNAPLATNQLLLHNESITLPNDIDPELNYWWLVVTDSGNAVSESIEANNSRVSDAPTWMVRQRAPYILAQPTVGTVFSGTSTTLSAIAGGWRPLQYQWQRNGTLLAGTESLSLSLTNLQAADSGNYALIVTNVYGSVTSAVAVVIVSNSPPFILTSPANQMVEPGTNVTFQVVADGARPLNFQWLKNGTPVSQGNASSLSLMNVGVNDSGYYLAIVSNQYGSATSAVASLSLFAVAETNFNAAANGAINAIAVQSDGNILVGGSFTSLGGVTRNRIGRLNPNGSVDAGFNPNANSYVYSVAIQPDGKFLVGGQFTTIGGLSRNYLARLNADGAVDTNFTTAANSTVYSVAFQADGRILVGGQFTTLGGLTRNRIGRLNADGTVDTNLTTTANNTVNSLVVQPDGKFLVGGQFTTIGGLARNYLARLNADGTVDTNFTTAANSYVYSLALQLDGKVLVVGNFTTLGGLTRNYLARLNADGSVDTNFTTAANSYVYSLALQADGKILVGGSFTTLGGLSRNYIGRLNGDGSVDGSFYRGANSTVSSLAIQPDGRILAGGNFTTMGGQPSSYFARLNNTIPATQSLAFDGSTVTWLYGDTAPATWRSSFDFSTNASDWVSLGDGSKISGGWQRTGVSAPTNCILRARGPVSGGQYNGSAWNVEAYYGRPLIFTQPVSRTNDAGSMAFFSVLAQGSTPIYYQWRKDGIPLSAATNVTGTSEAYFAISNALGNNAGQYDVVISNQFGSVTSQVARLVVNDPVIAVQPVGAAREIGQSVTFSVSAKGAAPLNYQWFKDGVMTLNGTESSLPLTYLQPFSAGDYWVVVSNQFGSVTSTVATLCIPAESDLLLNHQLAGRLRTPCAVDRWNFSATAGRQIRFNLLGLSQTGGVFRLSGPGNWVGFSNLSTNSTLITLPSSGTYTLSASVAGGQSDIAYAFQMVETTQTPLPIGTNFVGQFVGSGQAQLFVFTVTNSGPFLLQLANAGAGNRFEVYAKLGAPPTRSDYDFRYSGQESGTERILIPDAAAGVWYVLVYGDYIPTASTFTLSATAADAFITDSSPKRTGNSPDVTLTINGAGFGSVVGVQLVEPYGTTFAPAQFNVISSQQMTARFTAGTVPAGVYTIRLLTSSGGVTELANALEIVSGGLPHLTTKVIVPSVIGYHAPATVYIEYANTGTAAMPAPLLSLTATQKGLQGAFLTLDQSRASESFWTDAIPAGYKTEVAILASGASAGVLQPGETRRVPIHYAGWLTTQWDFSRPPILFSLSNTTAEDTTPVDWSALFLPQHPAESDPAWQTILGNVQTNMGITWGQHVLALGRMATSLYQLSGQVILDADQLKFQLLQGAGEIPAPQQPRLAQAAFVENGSPASDSPTGPSPGTIYSYQPVSGTWTELAPYDNTLNTNWPTVVIIHGWDDNVNAGWEALMASAIYSKPPSPNINIMAVDWSLWADTGPDLVLDAARAAESIPQVARRVAWRLFASRGTQMAGEVDFIIGLGLKPENTHLIGHSHGAHVAGLTAEYSRYEFGKGNVRRVTALDPSCEYSHRKAGNIWGSGWGNYGRSKSATYIDSYRSSKGGPWFRTYGDDNFLLAMNNYTYDDPRLGDDVKHFWAYQWFTQTIFNGGGALGLGYNWGPGSWGTKTTGFQFNGSAGPWKGLIRGGSSQDALEGLSRVVENPSVYSDAWFYPGAWGTANWEVAILDSLAHSVEFQPFCDGPSKITWPAGGNATVPFHVVDNSGIKSISRVLRQSTGTQLADSIYRVWLSHDTNLNPSAAIDVSGVLFLYPGQWTTPEETVKSINASVHLPSMQDIVSKWGTLSWPATFYLIVELSPSRLKDLYPGNNRSAIEVQISGEAVSAYVQPVLQSDNDGNGFELVNLDGIRSGPKARIVNYLWKLDGTVIDQGATLDHLNANVAIGSHTVELIVTDDSGQQHSATASVIVHTKVPQPPKNPGGEGSTTAVTSSDPNEKIGPGGYGAEGFIRGDQLMPYRIDFENDTNATAPAQIVEVTDQLSTNLDWTTFELTEIGFGSTLISIPPGLQYYEDIVPMTYNGVNFEVWIYAGIDFATGEAYAEFYSVDPVSFLPPDVLIGFLPPEDGTKRGQGHVSYTIRLKTGLPTGTQIRNVADIQFDQGEVIATNQRNPHDPSEGTDPAKECLNTIDIDSPGSMVLSLPATTNRSEFAVQWFGSDVGSGIASCDIYVQTNGGAWSLWLAGTTNNSNLFAGENGKSYAFYSVARDNVGNVEAAPDSADATTTVDSQLFVTTTVQTLPAGLPISVDGTNYAAPQSFVWILGSSHTLAAAVTNSGIGDTRYLWSSWSDGGVLSHQVVASADSTNTAHFTTQYYLTLTAGKGGTVNPPDGWYASNTPVTVSASYGINYGFAGWTGTGAGSYTGPSNSAVVYMNGPVSESAAFANLYPNYLTVKFIGKGTLSPNYSNAALAIGTNYSLTATPATGFVFTNWTGWVDGAAVLTTNKAALKFMMRSNLMLVATLLDVTKPVLTITNMAAGLRVSNAVFTVKGRVTDNGPVSNVWYQLNTNDWVAATTTNGWTNWSASVALIKGTNTFTAYAVDAAGNRSTNVSSKVYYVLSAPITINTVGKGTVKGAINGQLIPIGTNVVLTTSNAPGYLLTNWLVQVDGATVLSTNKAKPFPMQSNLVLTVTFIDVQKPVATITNMPASLRVSNAVFTVKGKVADNGPVTNVFYQLNGGAWTNAVTANGWSNWSASVTLASSTNTITAYAVDAAGNRSTNVSAKVVYVVTAPLGLNIVGNGTIKGAVNGQLFEIGKTVTLTNTPGTGFILTNWLVQVDGATVLSTNKATPFPMQSNLVLTVTFVDTNKPVLSITNMAAGLRVSNAVFTVKGKVTDNGPVTNVFYQLNGGVWTNAVTANGWSNWSASVTLASSTNTITAYAVDAAGNRSTNVSAKVVYVVPVPVTQFPIASSAGVELSISLASTGTNYLAAILGDALGGNKITAQLFSTNGSLIGTRLQTGRTGSVPGGLPQVAYGSNTYLMVWADNATTKDVTYGQLITAAGALKGSAFPIASLGSVRQTLSPPGVAYGNGNFLVVWNDDRSGQTNIYGRLVSPTGTLGSEFAISASSIYTDRQLEPAVAFDGNNYLVAWEQKNGFGWWDAEAVLVSPAGSLVGSPFLINQTYSSPKYNPLSLAFDGSRYLVAWNYNTNNLWDIQARFVTTGGAVSGNQFDITTAAGNQILPRVAFGQGKYLVLWSDQIFDGTGVYNIRGRLFDLSGQAVGAEATPFTAVGSNKPMLAGVINDGNHFVAVGTLGVMTSGSPTSGDVYVTFMNGLVPIAAQSANVATAKNVTQPQFKLQCVIGNQAVGGGGLTMQVSGSTGAMVVIESSPDLIHWQPIQTNTMPAKGISITVPTTGQPTQFYRAVPQ